MYSDSSGSIISKIVVAIFALAFLDLVFINWWILKKADSALTYTNPTEKVVRVGESSANTSSSAKMTQNANTKTDDVPASGESDAPDIANTPVVETIVQTPNKEIFVPLGSGQTRESSFVDLYGAEVSIDTAKYSEIESVSLEAFVWVDGGNGLAWAQLKNVSDNNPFIESQISNSTLTPTLKVSGKIPIPQGSKTYRVQAKTDLADYAAHVDNARLKIVLK